MMNQEVKGKWTAALRSGQYKQGQRSLRHRNEDGTQQHCCLGVLCDIAVAEGVIPEPYVNDVGDYEYPSTHPDGTEAWPEAGILPAKVYTWAGLPDGNPNVIVDVRILPDGKGVVGESGMVTLAELNDHGSSFHEIADAIDNDL